MSDAITPINVLRAIVRDGYLSDTNTARARELLQAADSTAEEVPDRSWRDQVVGMRYVDGAGLRPSVRTNPETLYLASDVHLVLAQLLNR